MGFENGFQDLKVWVKAHSLVLEIYKLTKNFPEEEKFCLVNQLRRSAISISANIAEGHQKTQKDFIRYLDISQASLEETKYYIILSKELKYLDEKIFNNLIDSANEIGKMLTGLKKTLRFG